MNRPMRVNPTMVRPNVTCAECGTKTCCQVIKGSSGSMSIWKCHDCIVEDLNEKHAGDVAELFQCRDLFIADLTDTVDTLKEIVWEKDDKIKFLDIPYDCGNVQESDPFKGDIKIIVQGDTLYAHKHVLCHRSPVFKRMFESDLSEKTNSTIHINDATRSVMQAVINSFYDSKIVFDLEKVTPEEVLDVVHKYDVPYLQRVCEDTMIVSMNEDNLTTRLKLAKKLDNNKVLKAAATYFKSDFDRLISKVADDLR